jgi:hypothetical protein
MSLSYRQERQLLLLETALIRSDPDLASLMGIFGRLYAGQHMPGGERMNRAPSSRKGLVATVTWIVSAALTATAAAVRIPLSRHAGERVGAGRQCRPQRRERAQGGAPWPGTFG